MANKLTIDVASSNGVTRVKLVGVIDGDSGFAKATIPNNPECVVDFDGVKGINSVGVREWIVFLESLPKEIRLAYENCHAVIAEQIAMVGGMARSGTEIRSCFLPYYCDQCDVEKERLLKMADYTGELPLEKCEKCGGEMEFEADDMALQRLFKRPK
jgi:hypothetical protein